MSISDSSIFASKPFTFIVQGTPLYVHASLVADCSGPLDRMINGHLSEAKQGFALLDDVDEGTFVRFIRWTYSRYYPAPDYSWAETGEGKDMPEGQKIEAEQKEASTSGDLLADWDGIEDIRTMLAHYVGTEMDTLVKYEEIKDLMLDNGEVFEEFLKNFASNIS
ncbi:MAG: hypothetical protein ASARMPREDX12_002547 [Alectoria sarmentosa]|nr:MAG: hypothetical protein ASARMPREDX12_002547 [Alectoria sarmentosa]